MFPVDSALFQDEKWSGLSWDSKSEGVPVPFGIDWSPVESSGVRWTPVDSDRNKGRRVKSSWWQTVKMVKKSTSSLCLNVREVVVVAGG